MIYYALKIESEAAGNIEIDVDNMITAADVNFDTINDSTQKKANAILVQMIVRGQISPEINDELVKISEWTRDLKNDTTYRDVTLTIMEDESKKILRIYEIPSMFVCDYKESYGAADSKDMGTFELKLTQKENKLKEIKTYKV